MKSFNILPAFALAILTVCTANAQEVRITPDIPFVELLLNNEFVVIERDQNNDAGVAPAFAKTSRPCPPFCIQPMSAGEGVATVGEVELIAFLENNVQAENGLLVDTRSAEFFNAGTIPGAINLPFNLFTASDMNPFLVPLMTRMGGQKQADGNWDFTAATPMLLFCNGPWCDESSSAINDLISVGYPVEKLFYYRGGMQSWLMFGLTVQVP